MCGTVRATSVDHDEPLSIGVVGQQLAAAVGNQGDIFDLHAEAEARLEYQRLEGKDHAGRERLLGRRAKIWVLMEMKAHAVADERDGRQIQLAQLAQIDLVNRPAA